MVRPVAPSPASSTYTEVQNPSGVPEDLSNAGYLPGDNELRRRLGPGFELRAGIGNGSPPQPHRARQEGAALYRGFLDYEFRRRNLPEPAHLFSPESAYYRTAEPVSSDVILAGEQLRILSDEFSRSAMRQRVEEQAARVPLEQLDFNAFSELLYGLFQEGGVTWERVVVLFYFCADLAARAFREHLPRQLHNIVEWSFKFFAGERMLKWVTENGGWVQVMQRSASQIYKLARVSFLIVGVLAVGAFLWRSR